MANSKAVNDSGRSVPINNSKQNPKQNITFHDTPDPEQLWCIDMLDAIEFPTAEIPSDKVHHGEVKQALYWAFEYGLNDKVEIKFPNEESPVSLTRGSVLRKKLQEWIAHLHGVKLEAAEPQAGEKGQEQEEEQGDETPLNILSAFLVQHPKVLDSCAELATPPTLQRMAPDRMKRVVLPATRAMQELWKRLESGVFPFSTEGLLDAVASAIFAAVDPDVVQLVNLLQDVEEAGMGRTELVNESGLFARMGEILKDTAPQVVLELRPRIARMLLEEVALYVESSENLPLVSTRQALVRTFTSTSKFLDQIPGVLAAIDGRLHTRDAWHQAWVNVINSFNGDALIEAEFITKTDEQWEADSNKTKARLNFQNVNSLKEEAAKHGHDTQSDGKATKTSLIEFLQRTDIANLKQKEQ